ncbi:MAG TPA: tail fiber domain-containing protein, partial [Pyrinomonadaceae bacterium]|nr:tail fiber domain-containing protein [Pyrinomonadaceae bacterium]
PLAGSANYIQNSSAPQANSNFNITGSGLAGGMLSGNIVNAATQFNLNGQGVLRASSGSGNLSVGIDSGAVNTLSNFNSFFGLRSGKFTTGSANSFFGALSGQSNTTGTGNSFFGTSAGSRNVDGSENSFFGTDAGGFTTSGGHNSFFGSGAGFQNTTGAGNSFFGASAGRGNTTGDSDAFFGNSAGRSNSTGSSDSFFGASAGSSNTTGINNSFFGTSAGSFNSTGFYNSFFGFGAGQFNSTGHDNEFFGGDAGSRNSDGVFNSFFGSSAGFNNTTGRNNSAFGAGAGLTNITGSFNSYLGDIADSMDGLTNATAIGNRAYVTQSNSLVLGSINGVNGANVTVNVGIGTTAPQQRLHVDGTEVLSTGFQSGFKFRDRGSSSANDDWVWYSAGNVARLFRAGVGDLFTVSQTGIVGLPVLGSAGSVPLCRNAAAQISGCSSSLRYKTNVNPFLTGLSLVRRLRPVSFNWKDGGAADVGLLAEEVNRVEPRLTFRNEQGEIEGVKYDQMSAVFINAIKEQQAQIEKQQAQIAAQEARIKALTTLVCARAGRKRACKTK